MMIYWMRVYLQRYRLIHIAPTSFNFLIKYCLQRLNAESNYILSYHLKIILIPFRISFSLWRGTIISSLPFPMYVVELTKGQFRN